MNVADSGTIVQELETCVQSVEHIFGITGIDPHMVAVALMGAAGLVVHFIHTRLGKARLG